MDEVELLYQESKLILVRAMNWQQSYKINKILYYDCTTQ